VTDSDVQRRLEILRENLERLAEIPQGSLAEFAGDFRNLDSALHRLQTSIQALLDLGALLVARLGLPAPRCSLEILSRLEEAERLPPGSTIRFRPIVGFRNRVVHLYDRIDEQIVYRILTEERGELAELLELLLDVHESTSSESP
jgi:uncharacterized protein YutE (UPF0331/DUF86 family)